MALCVLKRAFTILAVNFKHPWVFTQDDTLRNYSLASRCQAYAHTVGLVHCHTLSCTHLQPTVQSNQIAEMRLRHVTNVPAAQFFRTCAQTSTSTRLRRDDLEELRSKVNEDAWL